MADGLVGGSEADRVELLALHEAYLQANATFDWEALQPIWSASPEATFFNLNGHAYRGREHWSRLWRFYAGIVRSGYWTPFDLGGVVGAEMATIWCRRRTARRWQCAEPPPRDLHHADEAFVSRSTMVFRQEEGRWRVVHAHFFEATDTPRPDGI